MIEPRLKRRFWILAAFFLFLAAWAFVRVTGISFSKDPNPVLVRIPKGTGSSAIARLLADAGAIQSPRFFRLLASAGARKRAFKYGTYLFEKNHYWSILRKLVRGDTYRLKVTIPEGWTSHEIAARLKAEGILENAETFEALVSSRSLEGKLFPETYFLEPYSEPETVIDFMTAQFEKHFTADLKARAAEMKMSEKQVLALASIIEREARVPAERPVISSVYHNRLRIGMPLAADPTVQYALSGGKSWPERLLYKDLKVSSPYNTYRNKGLPPGPICNPGADSIRAALHPAQTDYLFFVADGTGAHQFFRTYREHMQYQREKARRNRSGAKSH